ncbi:MFS transporter [Persicobacter psychrovividus]|uniref:Hexuronate transporter n=1 Tax=Persicobacter psychrovividus TaxID=387638 RepID=A0ABN6LHD4_9BACT|nr:hexuronate transporter [Persicobacter psychrovividus]
MKSKNEWKGSAKKVKTNMRWVIIGLIALATVINYIDRSALAMMWPDIAKDLDLTKADYALILNIFMVAYALGQSFSGKIFDKVGTRFGYVISIGIWSISSFCHSFVRGIFGFGFLRSTLGFGEAGNWPGAVKSNAEWFPIKERAFAQGLFNAGASLGAVVAPLLIAYLWAAFGWRTTFMFVGSFGMLWILPWILINKGNPKNHPWVNEAECEYIKSGQSEEDNDENSKAMSLKEILSHRACWAVLASRFFFEPIWWLFVGWMPIYLADTYGFNVKEIGMFAWVPYVGAALGSIVGGYYSGLLLKQGKTVNYARKKTIIIGGAIMFLGLVATILFAKTPEVFVAIVAFVLFGFQFAIGNVQTIPSDLLAGKSVGSLAGLGGTVGVLSVVLMNFLVAKISSVSYTPVFILIAVLVPLGVGSIFLLAKNLKPVEKN